MTEHTQNPTAESGKNHWLDHPYTSKRLWVGFILILVVLVVSEFFVTHSHEGFMFTTGFHAAFGLIVGAVSIVFSKGWKKILKRKDTYYDQ